MIKIKFAKRPLAFFVWLLTVSLVLTGILGACDVQAKLITISDGIDDTAYFPGKIGIGTTNPGTQLTVSKTLADAHWNALNVSYNGSWSAYQNKHANIVFGNNASSLTGNPIAAIGATYDGYGRIDFHSLYNSGFKTDDDIVMSIRGNGTVGIGTTIPRSKLEVVSGTANLNADVAGTAADFTSATPSGQGSIVSIESNDAVAANMGGVLGFGGRYSGTSYANWASIKGLKADATSGNYGGYMSFWTRLHGAGSAERMRITDTGNVGIGTTTPSAGLEVLTGGTYSILAGNKRIGNVASPVNGADAVNRDYVDTNFVASTSLPTITNAFVNGGNYFGSKAILGTNDNQALGIETNSAERMTILANGNVGIGTTSPNRKVVIKGGHSDTTFKMYSTGDGGTNDAILSLWASEPSISYTGAGIGNNIDGSSYYGRVNTARGASYIRLLDNSISLYTVNSSGTSTNNMSMSAGAVSVPGTLATAGTLYVNGGLTQDGNVILNGSDTWLRTTGSTGWYSATYGGGIYMTDTSWVRTYNNKPLYVNGDGTNSAVFMSGKVGIGTTTPSAGLEVLTGGTYSILAGNKRIGNVASPVNGADAVNRDYVDTNFVASTSLPTITNAFVNGGNYFGSKAILGTNDNQALGIETNSAERMTILANGNVGIGVTNPRGKLEVVNGVLPSGAGDKAGDLTVVGVTRIFNQNWGNIIVQTNDMLVQDAGGSIGFGGVINDTGAVYATFAGIKAGKDNAISGQNGGYLTFGTRANGANVSERMRITSAGNVGIGTTNPGSKLSIGGGQNTDEARLSFLASDNSQRFIMETDLDGTTSNDLLGFRSVNTDNILVLKADGNVGIGTTNPEIKLHILQATALGGTAGNSQMAQSLEMETGGSQMFERVWLYRDAAGSDWTTARVHNALGVDGSYKTPGTDTRVWWERDPSNNIQSWGNAASTYLTINTGNVGIGTTNPAQKLDVNGNINMSNAGSTINASTSLTIISNPTCFSGETLIKTPTGEKPISSLKTGDYVISYNLDRQENTESKILDIFVREVDNYYLLKIADKSVKVTAEHPFYTKKGWVKVKDLNLGEELFNGSAWLKMTDKNLVFEKLLVYNMHVDGPNDYFAAGVLVHNKVGTSAKLHFTNTGFLGVGTVNPTRTLDVVGDFQVSGNSYLLGQYLTLGASTLPVVMYFGNGAYLHQEQDYFGFSGVSNWAFTNGGSKIGIGTTTPSAHLTIKGNTDTEGLRIISSNYSPLIIRNTSDTNDLFRVDQNGDANLAGGLITGDNIAVTGDITASGIGSSNEGGSGSSFNIRAAYGTGVKGGDVSILGGDSSIGQRGNVLLAATFGNVGIGTTSPKYTLAVNGNVGASAYYSLSDRRLKADIKPIDNALRKVLRLKGVNFIFRESGTPGIGLIAQDVEKVFPEVVNDDNPKSIQYANLVAPLIEAIKEQQKMIDNLEARVIILEKNRK